MSDAATMLTTMARYNLHMNSRVLDAMDQASVKGGESDKLATVRKTMAHVHSAQAVWLARLGADPHLPTDPGDDLRSALMASSEQLLRHIDGASGADLDATCFYRDTKGNAHERIAWHIFLQVLNHGTHHRAESGLLLAELGQSPGDMDFILYSIEHL
jgi:uncharacterized damage-inducible protein DinB